MNTKETGLTLLELTIVLLILVALAGLAVPFLGNTANFAQCQATDASLLTVKQAIMGGRSGPGFYNDLLGQLPRDRGLIDYQLGYLFVRDDDLDNDGDGNATAVNGTFDPEDEWPPFNPNTGYGWRGPYLQNGSPAPQGLDASFTDVFDAVTLTGTVHVAINAGDPNQVLDAWGRPIVLQVPADIDARLISAGPDGILDTAINDNDAANRDDDRVLFLRRADSGNNQDCG